MSYFAHRTLAWTLAIIGIAVAGTAFVFRHMPAASEVSLMERPIASVVKIEILQNGKKIGIQWSGFFVSTGGLILTSAHVASDPLARYRITRNDGEILMGSLRSVDIGRDIALIQAENYYSTIVPALLRSTENMIHTWSMVVSVGFPQPHGELRMLTGAIQAWRQGEMQLTHMNLSLISGFSGGPVIDELGNVIGINTSASSFGAPVSYATPLTQRFIDSILL